MAQSTENSPVFLGIADDGGHGHKAADLQVPVLPEPVKERDELLGKEAELALLPRHVHLQESLNRNALFPGLEVDRVGELDGVDGVDQDGLSQDALHLVGLQVPDQVPADILRQLRLLSQHLLDFVLPEIPDPQVIGLPYPLDRVRLADGDQRHILPASSGPFAGLPQGSLHRCEIVLNHAAPFRFPGTSAVPH